MSKPPLASDPRQRSGPPQSQPGHHGNRWGWFAAALTAATVIAGLAWQSRLRPVSLPPPVPFANSAADTRQTFGRSVLSPPPIRKSRFLNTSLKVDYIGREACAKCHPREHESYLQTDHGRALGDVNASSEPPDAEVEHAPSGRRYRVFREGDQLWHSESLKAADGRELASAAHPLRYAIGSGHHSRSYLVESEGFLIESPLTWYASRKAWGMSPGYDGPQHSSFERLADVGCLYCHAGQVAPVEGNRYRVAIHEAVISCESCHGPGALHAAKHAGAVASAGGDEDLTIVHPGRLTREENESICAQCHLRGAATVTVRGRRLTDFRPGLRMIDFRVDYLSEAASGQMKVVGHVEQMWASACYRQSDALTCTTCHDPHFRPAASEQIEYYRAKCNDCHHEHCGLARDERLKQNQQDDCVACHMPRRPTDLPHFAFTHHRIGLHAADELAQSAAKSVASLTPLDNPTSLSESDRARLLGLAYLEVADLEGRPAYRLRSEAMLRQAYAGGVRDPDVTAGLARLAWERNDLSTARGLAVEALTQDDLASGARTNARFILADSYSRLGNLELALPLLNRLAADRRIAEHWFLLGRCRARADDLAGAADALRKAVEISPFRSDIRELLTRVYGDLGDDAHAQEQRSVAEQLKTLASGLAP